MTYGEILRMLQAGGIPLAVYAIRQMMWMVQDMTGEPQSMNDAAPDWILAQSLDAISTAGVSRSA